MRRAVMVILDGLRRDMISETHTPRLAALARSATRFTNHRSVFPSTTRVSSASLATGCFPSRHELSGNTLALIEDGGLVVHDAGHPDFLQHKRRLTGRSLGAPTLAERTKDAGGAVVFSNVSPGAAYAQDPDGFGYVYHRAGSFGPGRVALPDSAHLKIGPEIEGDRAMTERFIDEVLHRGQAVLGVLWLGHPDTTQHADPLGSPAHLAALSVADGHAGLVIDAVARLRDRGEEVLLIIGSDHGHQTVTGTIDIEAELVAAGLKAGEDSLDVVVAANGTASLIYLAPEHRHLAADVAGFLASRPWAEHVIDAAGLPGVGLSPQHGLAAAVSLRSEREPNAYGVIGTALVARERGKKKGVPVGCGQHGGLGPYEQAPFLMVSGSSFGPTKIQEVATSLVDVAPTILRHLGLPADGVEGRALQDVTREESSKSEIASHTAGDPPR